MRFNPQMLMQMMMQKNPQMVNQFQMFQQMMNNNPQVRQQYQLFRNNLMSNPQLQEKAFEEAKQKINDLPLVGNQKQ